MVLRVTPHPSVVMEGNDHSLVQQAAALKVKYRAFTEPVRVPPSLIGFHPANRSGEPPNGDRCRKLFDSIYKGGFDDNEADCGGVLVQEKPGGTAYHDYNVRFAKGATSSQRLPMAWECNTAAWSTATSTRS